MRFSVVIPAFNEERYLPRLLDSIETARGRYAGGPASIEVIVADNASSDATAEVAAGRGCRVAQVQKRIIAAARNGGARAAHGEILAFVDADTVRIHPDTFGAIDSLVSSGRYVGGATGVEPERWSAGLYVTWAVFLPFVWLTRFDTGVVFCRSKDFEAVGGYDESRPVAEDVAFLLALRRLGRRRGQRLVRARRVKAVASTRKFDQFGEWHYLGMMPRFALQFLLGRPGAREMLDRYWYRPSR